MALPHLPGSKGVPGCLSTHPPRPEALGELSVPVTHNRDILLSLSPGPCPFRHLITHQYQPDKDSEALSCLLGR